MWIIPFSGHNRFNIYQIVQRIILHQYWKKFLIPYGYLIPFFINRHIHVLICSCCNCTMHHVVSCCKKMWNYINYSIMKWYIIILFNYDVYHAFVPLSKHISITSKSCSYLITQNKMGYNHPNFFQSRMWLFDRWRYPKIKGYPSYFTSLYKVICFFIIMWLYRVCIISLHDHHTMLFF